MIINGVRYTAKESESCDDCDFAFGSKQCLFALCSPNDRLDDRYVIWKKSIYGRQKSPDNPISTQVGGDHYKNLAIQPVEYITRNKLGFNEGNIVKYISRHQHKNKAQDIEKAIHYAKIILKLQYNYSDEQINEL